MKLLIVEDEAVIRRGLVTSMNWDELGVTEVEAAKNGQEALDRLPHFQPDVVMTDIRMPKVDGLTLLQKLKEDSPGLFTILLSGYQEFDYAQKAIRLGVTEYLIKPVDKKEIAAVMARIAMQKKDRESKSETLAKAQNQERTEWFNSLMMEGGFVSDTLWQRAGELGISFMEGKHRLFFVEVDNYPILKETWKVEDFQRLYRDVQLFLDEEMPSEYTIQFWPVQAFRCGAIVSSHQSLNLKPLLDALRHKVKEAYQVSITIGMSREFQDARVLPFPMQEAKAALLRKRYEGKDTIYMAAGQREELKHAGDGASFDGPSFMKAINEGNTGHVKKALQQQFRAFKLSRTPLPEVRTWCLKLLLYTREDTQIPVKAEDLFTALNRFDNLKDMAELMVTNFSEMLKEAEVWRENHGNALVLRTIHYLEAHYDEPLTLDELAKYSFVSPSHLSRMFKKETGTTFVKWLNEYRVEKAKQMFKASPALPIYKVAEETGYPDYKYFVKVFKANVGLTPKEYKANLERHSI
ncbi:response regulator [Halobacillus kuroshimensis]|uniref:Response regulator n=1 Tax=Halobacillus kuroshimensis TaxID=302481 RepID=A0ABS3DYK0_9BACI|nr:response regulator [Halobacillus kuroshimensis]MBN8236412.1 response regulator [Halobacillus kuroshimensis]